MTKKQQEAFKRSKHEELFAIAKNNKKYVIVVGNAMVSKKQFDTIEQAEEYIAKKPYELIFNTCLFLFNNYENVKKENAKSEESSESSK